MTSNGQVQQLDGACHFLGNEEEQTLASLEICGRDEFLETSNYVNK